MTPSWPLLAALARQPLDSAGVAPEVVRDTVRAIADALPYRRSLRTTLGERMWRWFVELLERLFDGAAGLPHGRTIGIVVLGIVVLLVVGRIVYASRLGVDELAPRRERGAGGRTLSLADADRVAAGGHYLEAVHVLYRAVLETLARRDGLRLHASKTSGDYARDLRRRGSASHLRFRQFARRHDHVVFGLASCDAATWAVLRAEAERALGTERAA